MADLEERLRSAALTNEPKPNLISLLHDAADHISAQTQTISDLTRALEQICALPTMHPILGGTKEQVNPVSSAQDIARAALSSAQSVSTEEEEHRD